MSGFRQAMYNAIKIYVPRLRESDVKVVKSSEDELALSQEPGKVSDVLVAPKFAVLHETPIALAENARSSVVQKKEMVDALWRRRAKKPEMSPIPLVALCVCPPALLQVSSKAVLYLEFIEEGGAADSALAESAQRRRQNAPAEIQRAGTLTDVEPSIRPMVMEVHAQLDCGGEVADGCECEREGGGSAGHERKSKETRARESIKERVVGGKSKPKERRESGRARPQPAPRSGIQRFSTEREVGRGRGRGHPTGDSRSCSRAGERRSITPVVVGGGLRDRTEDLGLRPRHNHPSGSSRNDPDSRSLPVSSSYYRPISFRFSFPFAFSLRSSLALVLFLLVVITFIAIALRLARIAIAPRPVFLCLAPHLPLMCPAPLAVLVALALPRERVQAQENNATAATAFAPFVSSATQYIPPTPYISPPGDTRRSRAGGGRGGGHWAFQFDEEASTMYPAPDGRLVMYCKGAYSAVCARLAPDPYEHRKPARPRRNRLASTPALGWGGRSRHRGVEKGRDLASGYPRACRGRAGNVLRLFCFFHIFSSAIHFTTHGAPCVEVVRQRPISECVEGAAKTEVAEGDDDMVATGVDINWERLTEHEREMNAECMGNGCRTNARAVDLVVDLLKNYFESEKSDNAGISLVCRDINRGTLPKAGDEGDTLRSSLSKARKAEAPSLGEHGPAQDSADTGPTQSPRAVAHWSLGGRICHLSLEEPFGYVEFVPPPSTRKPRWGAEARRACVRVPAARTGSRKIIVAENPSISSSPIAKIFALGQSSPCKAPARRQYVAGHRKTFRERHLQQNERADYAQVQVAAQSDSPIENWETGVGSPGDLPPETPAIEAWE
ncbi:hypothetical protein DFH06DRAFT_1127479 [Mycena polygramma]|nr:hypothetical protein DFH06DRAFT_1127479 [Mycena polygramma]